jgi:hypothetical protein
VPRTRALTIGAGLLLLALLIVRTAWMCDDAYITMRSIDNVVHGYGPRWNVAEPSRGPASAKVTILHYYDYQ